MRSAPADPAEMVTQLLFGDLVTLLATDRQWMHIRVLADGYEGWIDSKMVVPAPADWEHTEPSWQYVRMPQVEVPVQFPDHSSRLHLSLGMRVPCAPAGPGVKDVHLKLEGWEARIPRACLLPHTKGSAASVVQLSARYLGAPYLWGGKSLWGIDCSGLTQQVMAMAGVQLPRDASQQVREGRVVEFGARRPGDLAFFENEKGKVIHVGVVLPGGQIRHASGFVRDDVLKESGIFRRDTRAQTHTLCSINRYI